MRLRMGRQRFRVLAAVVDEQIYQQKCKIERLTHEGKRLLGYGMSEAELDARISAEQARLADMQSVRAEIRSQIAVQGGKI